MLNKLLKRCMPWMDKGRWYHVRVDTTGETLVSSFDPVFFNVVNTGSHVRVSIVPDIKFQMVDVKANVIKPGSEMPNLIAYLSPVYYEISGNYSIDLKKQDDSIVEYWFFLRPLER